MSIFKKKTSYSIYRPRFLTVCLVPWWNSRLLCLYPWRSSMLQSWFGWARYSMGMQDRNARRVQIWQDSSVVRGIWLSRWSVHFGRVMRIGVYNWSNQRESEKVKLLGIEQWILKQWLEWRETVQRYLSWVVREFAVCHSCHNLTATTISNRK